MAGAVSLKTIRMKHDVENIERATLAAVSSEAVLELPGWLLAFDPVDGASRVKRLSQAPGSVFGSVREAG